MKRLITFTILAFSAAFIFVACNESTEQAREEALTDDYAEIKERGAAIVATAFDSLRTHLTSVMQASGPPAAVAYCQVEASSILASARSGRTEIRRATQKWRNSENEPSDVESGVLDQMQRQLVTGKKAQPVVTLDGAETHYYHPIFIQPLCLNCHGEPGVDINEATLAVIDSLYPNDRARGYKADDLRGMWHIVMHDETAAN